MASKEKAVHDHEAFLAGEKPKDPVLAMLWSASHLSREREAAKVPEKIPRIAEQDADTGSIEKNPVPKSQPLEARLRAAARDMQKFGGEDVFHQYPVNPNNEFPTLLTRLPIFRPSRRVTQQKFQDSDNTVSFETPWGEGRRHGPPLTIRDEDTLIALLMLRNRGLTGPSSHLPENVRDIYKSNDGKSDVHRVTCTIDQINEFLGLSDGGKNFQNTLASVKRLNACKIELDRVVFDGSRVGGAFDLVKIQWRLWDEHGLIDAVFPPLMAHWLMKSYTFIEWDTRKQLTPMGKALHRFLSGQRPNYSISLIKLSKTIGYDGRPKQAKSDISKALDILVKIGWLASYEITGSGRAIPHIVHVIRADN